MRKIRRKKFKLHFRSSLLLLIIVMLLFLIISKTYFRGPIMAYAKNKSYYYASVLINNAISEQVVPTIDTSKMINLETKSNGYVTSVVVDVYQVNLIVSKMTKMIQDEMIKLQNDKSNELNSLKVPLGVMFDNPILNGLGPDINISLRMVGSVQSDIASSIKPYGINNSLIEIMIKTKVRFQVMIPYQRDEIEIVTNTPLLIKVIQGSVPHYYYTGGQGNINLPSQDSINPNSSFLE